jgi:hypothetical protein
LGSGCCIGIDMLSGEGSDSATVSIFFFIPCHWITACWWIYFIRESFAVGDESRLRVPWLASGALAKKGDRLSALGHGMKKQQNAMRFYTGGSYRVVESLHALCCRSPNRVKGFESCNPENKACYFYAVHAVSDTGLGHH